MCILFTLGTVSSVRLCEKESPLSGKCTMGLKVGFGILIWC